MNCTFFFSKKCASQFCLPNDVFFSKWDFYFDGSQPFSMTTLLSVNVDLSKEGNKIRQGQAESVNSLYL